MHNLGRVLKIFLPILLALSLSACSARGQEASDPAESTKKASAELPSGEASEAATILDFEQMHWEKGMELSYATQFFVEKCGEYQLITIVANDRFLLIPEDGRKPLNVPDDVTVLQKPLDHVYLASSSVFDLVREVGALDHLRLSGTKKEDLSIQEAVSAMENGSLVYAGKYSKPDYELMIAQECDLAIENTMIYHNPETKEKLESLGIPVLVETSSYEEHPFGRMEWIKLYGLLFDKEEEAQSFFEQKVSSLKPILQQETTGLKVAFFYVNSNGAVNVRKPGDYVAKMISLAGGEYVLTKLEEGEENALSTMNMQMEDFYLAARDADVVIYNSTIVGELQNVKELL
ncbi:MAG: ABC transporter substrate-binding protein, partial [Lachnospiraceae bacterium]|nr:ABC transporter substrate-binding protein [Lachnospiraceae bacterium]